MNYFPNSAFLQIQINDGGPKNKHSWKNTWGHTKKEISQGFSSQVRARWYNMKKKIILPKLKSVVAPKYYFIYLLY